MDNFTYNLRKIREMKQFSPEQMGDIIGKSERTWQKIESGERDLTRGEMKLVAKALDIPEEMMMSLDKCNIFNSFNNNQEGYYFSNNNEMRPSNLENGEDKILRLEKKLDTLEQKVSNLLGR